MIGIIDYGVGNIKAFANIYKNFDMPYKIVKTTEDLNSVAKLILPGVGSFDHAMTSLQNSGMRETLDELVLVKKLPVIGICVGMQMLASSSDEGKLSGLGWIDGVVKKFDKKKIEKGPLPHMGWNTLNIKKENTIFAKLENNPRYYFLHSYYFDCNNKEDVIATATYGEEFECMINHENIYGIQPHPEKSHHNGMQLLKNFGELLMLEPRIIPCLLVHNKGLVKTVKFKEPKYVGDPINAVKIFNEKESDELMVLDIDATVEEREPDYKMIENLAVECRMPLCYGGGIKNVQQATKIFNLGVEKIALSASAIETPQLVADIAKEVGNQSVVVVLDVKKKMFGGYDIYTHNATKKSKINLEEFIKELQELGVGEIVVNSIDNDGVMKGYDISLIEKLKPIVNVPMTVLGGAGTLDDIKSLISKFGIIGCAAGSLFVFKGKYKAVLINYPKQVEKDEFSISKLK